MLSILLFSTILLLSFGSISEQTTQADHVEGHPADINNIDNEENDSSVSKVKPYMTPSDHAVKVLGWYLGAGYSLQPKDNYYIPLNNKLTIRTRVEHNSVGLITLDDDYRWFFSEDGLLWKPVTTENDQLEQKRDLTVSSSTEKTVYYQATTQVHPRRYNPLTVSNMSTVHFVNYEVDAESMTVTTDTDYMFTNPEYKNETMHAHAFPFPKNATGMVEWSIKESDLATIDKYTGEIKVNNKKQSGIANVTAKIHNPNGTTVQGTTSFQVGQMLTLDGPVFHDHDAKLTLHGHFDSKAASITWYKKGNRGPEKIDNDNKTELLIKADKKYTIYAEIKAPKENDPTKYESMNTNEITINPTDYKPSIDSNYKIINKSHEPSNVRSTLLENVVPGDKLVHQIELTDTSSNAHSSGQQGNLDIPISTNEDVSSVKVNDTELSKKNYSVEIKEHHKKVILKELHIKRHQKVNIEVDTDVTNSSQELFNYFPSYNIKINSNDFHSIQINEANVSFVKNSIYLEANNLDFGVKPKIAGQILNRESEGEIDEILNVEDTRRSKHPVKLFLKIQEPFKKDDDATEKADMTFRYYDRTGNEHPVTTDSMEIHKSDAEHELKSLRWQKHEGLKIHIFGTNFKDGTYTSTLCWTINNAP